VWERGLGKQDIEANVNTSPDTPYFIGDLSQVIGASLVLRKCLEQDSLELSDRVTRWLPEYPDREVTIEQLLTHSTNDGVFKYDLARFSALTAVVEECADLPYRHIVNDEVFERFAMASSAPGLAVGGAAQPGGVLFPEPTLARFAEVARRTAPAYRVDRGRPVRSDTAPLPLSAAVGIVSSVRDLLRFDVALNSGVIIEPPQMVTSWTQAQPSGVAIPSGRGWFVQNYKGEAVIWQFGLVVNGHSALMIKVPARNLTFVVLANSDGLTAGYNLANGDVTASPFGSLFLRFFVP
jgi:CubicO group peptidase (beta-lactamase class C family)